MSVEVARTSVYPNGLDVLESSSGDTEEFIKSVKDSLQRGRYDTKPTNKLFGTIDSEDEQPSLPLDDEADIGSFGRNGNSLTEVVELPTSDDEDDESQWLSPHMQNKLLKVAQTTPGVEDLFVTHPTDNVKNNKESSYDADKNNHTGSGVSNHCFVTKPPTSKRLSRRNTCGQLLPKNSVAEKLVEFLKQRSRSLSYLDTEDLLDVKPSNDLEVNETSYCNENTVRSRRSSREIEDTSHRLPPKKRCSSAESRNSIGGESSHRYSETSSYSDSDSLRRRYFGWGRRFSNYSVATTHTTLSSFIEPEAAVDLAENLMIELFDTDDIDGIIPARFLQTNQEAIVDNIREEEYSPSYSPTASCGQSSFDEDYLPPNFSSELTSEIRLSTASSPHNTGSPRSSRHSKSSSPERTDPISLYPNEGSMPRNSMFSMPNMNMQLDTVEEETASQISPSPRVMSPRISIDNGENFDALVDLHTKPTQQITHRLSVPHMRKISLQREHREHHRFSVESMPVSENSFYFSVTSFDDDIVGKMEMIEDPTPSPKLDRRQRRVATVSTPNASVLQWLANMPKDTPTNLDPDEPWPFNESNASSTAASEVTMETLAVPERRISLSETSDLDSFHSCRDDYASSNISGQDSFDYTQLDSNQNDIIDQNDDQDKEATLRKDMTIDQQTAWRRQRLKQQREAIDCDDS